MRSWLQAFALATSCVVAACMSSGQTNGTSTPATAVASAKPAGAIGSAARSMMNHRPLGLSNSALLADMAIRRLGGGSSAGHPHVTGVSIADGYGLAVYQAGQGMSETLFLQQGEAWRVLASDVYYPDGRGLLRVGLSPALARKLIAGLKPPPVTKPSHK